MNKTLLFNNVKEKINETVNDMTESNITETNQTIQKYFDFITQLRDMPDTIFYQTVSEEETLDDDDNQEIVEQEQDDTKIEYQFARQLRGGHLPEINAFVPESVIKTLEIVDGDYLYAQNIKGDRYHYEVARRTGQPRPERVEVNYGIVSQRNDEWVVDKTCFESSIIIYDVLQVFRISSEDMKKFDLQEGSIVDLAFLKGKPATAKVIWVYPTDFNEHQKPQKSSVYREKNQPKQEKNKTKQEKNDQRLKDKTVLVIGNEPHKLSYEKAINREGGNMIWLEGIEKEETIRSCVRKANVVTVVTAFCRHYASTTTRRICDEENVDISFVKQMGITSLVESAINPQMVMA